MNGGSAQQMGEIAYLFLSIRDQIKIAHWQTMSYARHKAADKFVAQFTDKMDQFMEVIQGARGVRLVMPVSNNNPLNNQTDTSALELLKAFAGWLTQPQGLPKYLQPTDTDLFNLRDEMLSLTNQTIYLFSLR